MLGVLKEIRHWAEIGIYGITVEGMKYTSKMKGEHLVRVGGDMCYPVQLLQEHYEKIKAACHKNGLRFFCAENRLRAMGDDLCCCGIEGMGWQPNTANLNHILYDAKGVNYTRGQLIYPIKNIGQSTISHKFERDKTYQEMMEVIARSTRVNELKPIK